MTPSNVFSEFRFKLFLKRFWRTHVLFGGPLVPLFQISGDVASGFQSQSGFCLIRFFAEANVMYIPWDPPLVLHMLTSWQSVTSSHACAEVGLGSNHLNRQSPGQKTNALPLCQRPGFRVSSFLLDSKQQVCKWFRRGFYCACINTFSIEVFCT